MASGRRRSRYGRNRKLSKKDRLISLAVFLLAAVIMLFVPEGEKQEPAKEVSSAVTTESSGDMSVHFLDVGQGSAALVEADGHYMLIDGGDRSHSSFVVSYLQRQGVEKLDYILATHYHADHLNGVIGAMRAFSCDRVLCPDYEGDSKLYQSFLKAAAEREIPLLHPSLNDSFNLGDAVFTVIAPVDYSYEDENNNSIGIRLVHGEDSFLFTGDAEAESEEDFCTTDAALDCTVYVAGHHGSAGSSTWSLLMKATPQYALISCGKDNSYGHPHEETLEKLACAGVKLFRTDLQGTVTAVSSGHGVTFDKEPAADDSEDAKGNAQ